MVGLFLIVAASFAHEVATSIGKWETSHRKESPYSFGFLDTLGAGAVLTLLAFIPLGSAGGIVFDPASLPTLLARLALEIPLAWAAVFAVTRADRSTAGFLRTITIPLLLAVDIVLGYTLHTGQMIGMLLIIMSLVLLCINHGIKRRGAGLILFVSIGAVATISLYKYNITHYNSVLVEQGSAYLILLAFFYLMARFHKGERPLRFLRRPVFFAQSCFAGAAAALSSFAYLFSAASVIATAGRACSILFSILSGRLYFHEKKLWVKIAAFALILIGLFLLA